MVFPKIAFYVFILLWQYPKIFTQFAIDIAISNIPPTIEYTESPKVTKFQFCSCHFPA